MDDTEITDAPRRGRPPRAQANGEARRRRKGLLDVMQYSRMNPFDDGMLDHDNYVYRWANDESGRLHALTVNDDYDFMTAEDVPGFDASQLDNESDGRLRLIVGQQGSKPLYAYLLRKPRNFWEADRHEVSDTFQGVMEGRIFNGETTETKESRPGGSDKFYAPSTNQIGSVGGATRRRGPVATRSL